MAYKRPDIYVEEVISPDNVGGGISTSVASFVGITEKGPSNKAMLLSSFEDFKRIFGNPVENENLYYSVRAFFQNGGSQCFVVRSVASDAGIAPASVSVGNNSADILTFKAGYRGYDSVGLAGNDLKVQLSLSGRFLSNFVDDTSADLAANVLDNASRIEVVSTNGIKAGDILKIQDDAGDATNTNIFYVKVKSTESRVVSGAIKHYINLAGSITFGVGQALTATNSKITLLTYDLVVSNDAGEQLESWVDLSMNRDSADYFETLLNDDLNGSLYITVSDLLASTAALSDTEIKSADLNVAKDLAGAIDAKATIAATDIIGSFSALDGKDSSNILCVPPSRAGGQIDDAMLPILHIAMLEYCGDRMDMFAILDAPVGKTASSTGQGSIGAYRSNTIGADSYWGALYYPHIKIVAEDMLTKLTIPPSGAVAGLYARVDQLPPPEGSVSTTPAGYGQFGLLNSVLDVDTEVSSSQHGDLNVIGVNCIKRVSQASGALPGVVVLGGRTLSSTLDFRYVNVRRMMTYIEESVVSLSRPYLFKNNNPAMWRRLTNTIDEFLSSLFRQGQLYGDNQEQAYFIKIDETINKPEDIKQGILNAEIGVALSRPAEFIVFKFSQSPLGGSEVTEV